ncbi:MAG: 50S ribosomal protein L6 [Clostridia bacterium]|nr:50S ribosomal protein L6 [Clostridia bacterium]
MSRIGRLPITIPAGVDVSVDENARKVIVKKNSTELSYVYDKTLSVSKEENMIKVTRSSDDPKIKALHGLARTLIANMVKGVTDGFEKKLVIEGVGYRAAKEGKKLVMNLGYSHDVVMEEIPGITIEVPNPNNITIKGAEKDKVGQFAADVRSKRPPEPYKGKGIRYLGEVIVLKEGKSGKK